MLLLAHAGGVGPPLATDVVRAAMAVRLNGIARGGAGASPRMADVLAEMLNAHVHPVVDERGSVGAVRKRPTSGSLRAASELKSAAVTR